MITVRAMGGLLERHADGWRWVDGAPEPRVHDVTPAEAFPFPTVTMVTARGERTTGVAIPRAALDEDRELFDEVIRRAGDDAAVSASGAEVPRATWDTWAGSTVIGVRWEPADEAAIFSRAEALKRGR
ncbi:MAG: hypothetical protein R3A52_15805 [Polyangiales bacterium]